MQNPDSFEGCNGGWNANTYIDMALYIEYL